ncbi:hypothetical protein [Pseudoduganella violacea]|uniref:Lipoprotein n=1 Tax=Pseudoduganella violacea TaxID=1715466 RepID=A0A7W5B7N0_9BURK|nr:hypothetical protein [Pseudoduganella violacea]MBB3117655.1 hypothetical protein [Pseudoduganella violacea]
MMRFSVGLICLPLILSGCSRDEAPAAPVPQATASADAAAAASAPLPAPAAVDEKVLLPQLMQAVFADAYRPASKDALAELPEPDERSVRSLHLITPTGAKVLENGLAALVVNGEMADEQGVTSTAHVTPGRLSVYLLRQEQGKWVVQRRHENVAELGSMGQSGSAQWVTLAPGKPGLAMLHGGTWQGYSIRFLSLFDLSDENMRHMLGEQVESDSEGACGPETSECWRVDGNWRIAAPADGQRYGDVLIDFSGEREALPQGVEGGKRVKRAVKGSARYSYRDGAYKLVDGANLVPGV